MIISKLLSEYHSLWLVLIFPTRLDTKKAESRFHNYFCRISLSLQSQLSFFGTHPFLFFKNLPLHFSIVNITPVLGIILLFISLFLFPSDISFSQVYHDINFWIICSFVQISPFFVWISIEYHLLFSLWLPILDLLFLLCPHFIFMWIIIMSIPIANKSISD